jgi:hypothetical protein
MTTQTDPDAPTGKELMVSILEANARKTRDPEHRKYLRAAAKKFGPVAKLCQRCQWRKTDPNGIGYAVHLCEKCATDRVNHYAH